jgi:hypothetical protein
MIANDVAEVLIQCIAYNQHDYRFRCSAPFTVDIPYFVIAIPAARRKLAKA